MTLLGFKTILHKICRSGKNSEGPAKNSWVLDLCMSSKMKTNFKKSVMLSYFLQKLVKDKKIHEARAFNFTYRYIDDVLSINNSRFAEFLPLIYPPELEVKETTDTASSASFLDLYLEFDDSGQLSTKIYDKRDDFNFKIINFPNMCSNIPASPAYGVYISQLIRYARGSSNYSDFLKRHLHLRNRLLDRAIKRFALFDLLKSLYSDTNILSKYIPSLQKKL